MVHDCWLSTAVTRSTQEGSACGELVGGECNKSDTAFIKEINVLTGSALAICNPLCHYTKLPQGPEVDVEVEAEAESVACSDTLLQSKRFESPAAIRVATSEAGPEAGTGAASAEALILHWQSGLLALVLTSASSIASFYLPLPLRTCDELCPKNGSCKNANAAQSKHRGNIWCWLLLFHSLSFCFCTLAA